MTFKILFTLALFTMTLTACNFHEVDSKEGFFRSAQLSRNDIESHILKDGIKTIINLRGEAKGQSWYDDEVDVSKQYGIQHVDIAMNAGRIPHRAHVLSLIQAYENLPRPILIHCLRGADRTGEAAAMWVMDMMGESKEKALKQLNKKYFYFSTFVPAKKYFIKDVYQGKEWAKVSYDPCKAEYKYYDKSKYCNPTAQLLIAQNKWDPSEDLDPEEAGDVNQLPEDEKEFFLNARQLWGL